MPATNSIPDEAQTITLPATLQRIVLTGFMGAGKTSVGRILADLLGWSFLDLDTHLETRAGSTIAALFETHGEAHFRRLESARTPSSPSAEAPPSNLPTASCSSKPPEPSWSSSTPPSRRSSTAACCKASPLPTTFGLCSPHPQKPQPASRHASPCTNASRDWLCPPKPYPQRKRPSPSSKALRSESNLAPSVAALLRPTGQPVAFLLSAIKFLPQSSSQHASNRLNPEEPRPARHTQHSLRVRRAG
jgi:hypothetical protein